MLGSVLAATGILRRFADFLTLLGVLIPPIAGIMVAEYFIVRRWRPVLDASRPLGRLPETEPAWVPATIVDMGRSGAGRQVLGWGMPRINSLLVAGVSTSSPASSAGRRRRTTPMAGRARSSSPPLGGSRCGSVSTSAGPTPTPYCSTGTPCVAAVKRATTPDVTVRRGRGARRAAGARPFDPRITAVMIGTTQFINALVEADGLTPAAVVRLGLPATAALPPLVDWPERLRAAVGGHVYLCHGGNEYDGGAITPLDPDELRRWPPTIAASGVRSVAITSVFSPVNAEFEQRAAEILASELAGRARLPVPRDRPDRPAAAGERHGHQRRPARSRRSRRRRDSRRR